MPPFVSKALFSVLCIISSVNAFNTVLSPVSTLKVVNKVIQPDGFSRSAVLGGGTFPAPPIIAHKGDRFKIEVVDLLTDHNMLVGTSIHWHGMFQNKTNFEDGASWVTQCPIVPGRSFTYEFYPHRQTGTYWYHSHYHAQYCDGLRGALVIKDCNDIHRKLYDVDDESTIITLADWYHHFAPGNTVTALPSSTLINGLGRYAGGPSSPLAVVNVEEGLRYRFRLVSLSCYSRFNFSIDGHDLTIIEADGISTKPLTVSNIDIFTGQRYSFVLTANQPIGNYWIRSDTDRNVTGFEGGINSAILRYRGAPEKEPTSISRSGVSKVLVETELTPARAMPVPGKPYVGGADVTINLDLALDEVNFLALVNGFTYTTPTVPVLLQILSGARSAQDLLPKGTVYTLPPNKVIEVSIPGGTLIDGPHPFHLHGHAFHIVRGAGSSEYNFNNPIVRDVTSVGDVGDNVTIRFVSDNAGPWIFHCHIDWHLELGLAVVFAEDPEGTSSLSPPSKWNELCKIYANEDPDSKWEL